MRHVLHNLFSRTLLIFFRKSECCRHPILFGNSAAISSVWKIQYGILFDIDSIWIFDMEFSSKEQPILVNEIFPPPQKKKSGNKDEDFKQLLCSQITMKLKRLKWRYGILFKRTTQSR